MRTCAHLMSPRARGLLLGLYAALSMAFLFLLQLPVMLVTRSGDFSIWLARRLWSASALRLAGVRVQAEAPHGIPEGPAIYASNHESALDVWVLLHTIPRNVRFVAKRELFRIPVFGWYLTLARFISVDRRDRAQAVAGLRRAGEIIRQGISLIVFPEGTRSVDAKVQPFKKGPFVVAMEAGVPVVPVAIAGAAALNPKRRLEVSPGLVRVRLGEPVMPRDFADKSDLLREVRRRIISQHRAIGGLGGDVDDAVAAPGMEGTSRWEAGALSSGPSTGYAPPRMSTRAEQQAPSNGASRPASRARSWVASARTAALKLTEDFRRSDRFFKMRLGIVGAWAILSIVTLCGTCGWSGGGNSLGADVQVNRDSIMGVQLLVRNESSHIWEDVTLTLDDGWKFSHRTMRPHDLVVLSMSHFRKGEDAPPRDYKPRSLVIECGQGSDRFDLR